MPLIHGKSKAALQNNIKAEMEAHPGKENRAQDLAIAFSVQRQARKRKMMAQGGEAMEACYPTKPNYASGGEVDARSIAEAIMHKRKMMAEGGMAEHEADTDEFNDINDDPTTSEVPEDVYQDEGSEFDSDAHEDDHDMDIVSRLRSRMKSRRGY